MLNFFRVAWQGRVWASGAGALDYPVRPADFTMALYPVTDPSAMLTSYPPFQLQGYQRYPWVVLTSTILHGTISTGLTEYFPL